MSKESSTSGGVGLSTVLLAIFVTLKLVGTITWSWWWVLSPLWIPIAIVIIILIFLGILFVVKR